MATKQYLPTPAAFQSDEALITDTRAALTPAQQLEQKLIGMLQKTPLPLSHSWLLGGSLRRGPSLNINESAA